MLNFRRQKSRSSEREHVIVKPFKTIEVRLPIEVLMSQPKYKKRRDLFLQGFSAVQQRNADDPTSFYAVAGIHGLPYLPYDILPGEKEPLTDYKGEKNRWGGYCHHGDILFPTWHRPYILLLEMLIHDAAEEMIRDNPDLYPPDNNETKEYTKELEKLRFPYWDWASPSTIFQGLPSVLFDEYVHVDNPTLQNIKIRNPLRAYTLPVNLGSLTLVGDVSNPTQRPYHPDGSVTPYTPAGYATVRHPSNKYITDEDATHLNVVTFCNSVFRPSLYQTFLVDKWRHFSNHGVHPDQEDEKNGHYSSIEIAHDAVHEAIGGNGGHMAYPDISAFDPIFFLHHCNVDRLLAIWQACHPDAWIEGYEFSAGTFTDDPNKKINENTNLTPFRKTADEYWTSKTVREIMKLGYTYPELPEGNEISPHQLLVETIKYYHPNEYLRYHWKLNLTVKKHKVGSPFQIRVFLDLPTASASTPKSSPNFAGLVSVFARGKETRCANCKVNPESLVNGHVDLTVCMQRLFINLNVKIEDDGSVLPNLLPNQITLIAVGKDGSDMKLEEAGLVSANYVAIDEFNNEQPEQWKVVYKNKIYPKTP